MMSHPRASISEIENYLTSYKYAVDSNPEALNLPKFERRNDYKSEIAKIDYWHYIQHADYH